MILHDLYGDGLLGELADGPQTLEKFAQLTGIGHLDHGAFSA